MNGALGLLLPRGIGARDAVRAARDAERIGYAACFVESDSPAPLLAAMGSATRRIRVGAWALPLRVHAPLQVASDFLLLAAALPGRVDLTVTDRIPPRSRAMGLVDDDRAKLVGSRYEKKLRELVAFLGHQHPVPAVPTGVPAPRLLLVGATALHRRIGEELHVAVAVHGSQKKGAVVVVDDAAKAADAARRAGSELALVRVPASAPKRS